MSNKHITNEGHVIITNYRQFWKLGEKAFFQTFDPYAIHNESVIR